MFWGTAAVLALTTIYAIVQAALVRPYLWPAGHGLVAAGDARFTGGSGMQTLSMLLARPPRAAIPPAGATVIEQVLTDSAAARAGLAPGDSIVGLGSAGGEPIIELDLLDAASPVEQVRVWRQTYWLGLRGRLVMEVAGGGGVGRRRTVEVDRPGAWQSGLFGEWAKRHLGLTIQVLVFTGTALVLLYLRSADATAAISILALALCAVGGGGPLMGGELALPSPLRQLLTVFAWIGGPLAFAMTGLAICYFPKRSPLLTRRPWLHAVPFAASSPMVLLGLGTSTYLAGVDAFEPVAVWDATHPQVYFGSFAASLLFNLAAVVEGLVRFRALTDLKERRRIRIVVLTVVPGVAAYAIRDGVPGFAELMTGRSIELPWLLRAFLQALVLLPAFGLAYAVAVHRVLAPHVVLRRSIQYALARNTLSVLTAAPVIALAIALVRQRDMTIGQIFSGAPLFYLALIAMAAAAFRYRERARVWLDQRFFREEYDARQILLSLANRVRFETDPSDLTTMVVNQIDAALHPETVAILISGLEEGLLTPVTVLQGSAESLRLDGGIVTMLRWSDEPLELYIDDPRSPARRLPAAEQEWLTCTGAALLVPILGEGRSLIGIIALGRRRSDEAYTAEDRALLASIASQVGLALDVVRLRRRAADAGEQTTALAADVRSPVASGTAMLECPCCGRTSDAGVALCPADGVALQPAGIPRVVDDKYRIDQLLGRGGMGAVYRARDVRLDRDVALKVVRADLLMRPDARRRFRREAQLVARLQHPAVVSIFDYGTFADGGAYLVMELVRGEDLRRVLKRDGPLPPSRVVGLLSAICAGIDAAHREGVLHRDLKPENIVIGAGDSEVKVLDFGVAKLIGADAGAEDERGTMLTREGMVVGTPAYMAPEQLRAQALTAATDVFALGVIAWEMTTGELPFGAGSAAEIALRQLQGLSVARRPADLPMAVERAIAAALDPDPERRPASAGALATLLRAGLLEEGGRT